LRAVAFNGAQIVAWGDTALASSDGLNWHYAGIDQKSSITDVVYAGDLFVAVGGYGHVAVSSNGEEWSTVRTSYLQGMNQVAFGNSLLVAVVDTFDGYYSGGRGLKYSADRVNWASANDRITFLSRFVLWDGNRFLVQGHIDTTYPPDPDVILSSTDGSHWSAAGSAPDSHRISQMIWTGRNYLAVAARADGMFAFMTSPDLSDWTEVSASPYYNDIWGLAASPSCMVAVNVSAIYASTDGAEWTRVSDSLKFEDEYDLMQDVVWTGSQFVAVSGKGIYTSPDGFAWTKRALPQKGA